MVRSLIITVFTILLFVYQTFDFVSIADKFGVPIAFSLILFAYFTKQIKSHDLSQEQYRKDMLELMSAQTGYLQSLVDRNFTELRCEYAATMKKPNSIQ